ncbi:WG repeat-containing protein [Flavobacterium reichenbachii]|uniref:WG repeat-containing protein n=1 Tax=Flavobacterium reichenbachii TaxID=362418 RepID=UPI00068A6FAC|nr:WG repeat-containing protein [Flavobacterium reichenbachii]OXB17865.1 hypothetical protein B0A68_02690 [Flavobacterium reichenbachii]
MISLNKHVSFRNILFFLLLSYHVQGQKNNSNAYDRIYDFEEGLANVLGFNSEEGYIDKNGNEVIALGKYKYSGQSFSNGLKTIRVPGEGQTKYGFIDKNGTIKIEPIYENAYPFKDGLAAVQKDGKWGYIDTSGKTVINFKYKRISFFREGLASVALDEEYGFINQKGELIIPYQYEWTFGFTEGLAKVNDGYKTYYIDTKGERKFTDDTNDVNNGEFSSGLAIIKQNDKEGFINKEGKTEIGPQYDKAYKFRGDIAIVIINGKYVLINKKGSLISSQSYDNAYYFQDGLCSVKLNKKWGCVDSTGKIIVPIIYDEIGFFSEGLLSVNLNGKNFYIDQNNKCKIFCN